MTVALTRAAEALENAHDEAVATAEGSARVAVSAALRNPDGLDPIGHELLRHRIECTGPDGVTCRSCRDLGWMGLASFARHQADAVRASILGGAS